jgi:protoporphyrinogen oxidase
MSSEELSPSALPSSAQHWAIVGGGMLGLATAHKLVQAGHKVTLIEAAEEIGGLTSAWRIGDVEWDKFYHVVLLSDQALRGLLDEVGLDEQIRWVTTRTGFFTDGKMHSLSNSLDFLRFRPLNLVQKFRLGCTILYASRVKGSARLENTLVDAWLRKLSGQTTFDKIWLPLLKAKLGQAYARTSAMFIWSYIDRMYKARRSGMKREMFGYVPGGYRNILTVLTEHLRKKGVKFLTSSPVESVVRNREQNLLELQVGTASNAQTLKFDRVIMTIPNPLISRACVELSDNEQQRLKAAEYLGVVCTSLLLDRPLSGYYVTNITDTWVPLTGIIEMGAIVEPQYLGGKYLVYLPQYMLSNDPRFNESDEVVHERCIATLQKMHPSFSRARVLAIQTARAKHVMTLPTLNYSQSLPPVVSSIPGLYLLNSAQVTVGCLNVNETIEIAHRELDRTILPDALNGKT